MFIRYKFLIKFVPKLQSFTKIFFFVLIWSELKILILFYLNLFCSLEN